jgi:hypothetical protein
MSVEEGYFLIARGFLDHPRFKPHGAFTPIEAMLWLIKEAAFAPRVITIRVGTTRRIVHLERGQLSHSIRTLAKAWSWGPNRVQGFLDDLEDDGTVNTHVDTGQKTITLCNYDKYQKPSGRANTQSDTQTNTQSDTTKKERKQLNKNTPSAEGFDRWYAIYPRKVQKQAAEKAFAKVIAASLISEPDLLTKTTAFAATWASRPVADRKYIPYPASWLNAGGYDDEPDAPANQAAMLPTASPADFSDAKWLANLKMSRDRDGEWSNLWGPRPGEPGCLVPSHLIVAPVPEGSLRAEVAIPLRR